MDSNAASLTHKPPLRCPACQLQLCKSRTLGPHAGLTEMSRDEAKQTTVYRCQTCAAALTRSSDLRVPGWTHAQATQMP